MKAIGVTGQEKAQVTGTAIERAQTGARARLAITEEERLWDHLIRKARVYTRGDMVPREMRSTPATADSPAVDRTDVVLAGMLMCRRLGCSEDSVPRLHVIEGRLEAPAEMVLGALHMAGMDTTVVRSDNEACVIEVSRNGLPPLVVEFTIADAKRAGLLDEWVERWQTTTGGKRYCEKFVLDRPGVDTPSWVDAERRAGRVKHKDNWWNYPADMLFSKAAKRAVRRYAPEVFFGIVDDIRRATRGAVSMVDDEVVDGEIVPPPTGDETDAVEREDGPAAPAPVFASESAKRSLLRLIDGLDDDQKTRLRTAAKQAAVPPLHGALVTVDHVAVMLALIDETDTPAWGRAGVEEVGGVDPTTSGPAPTYAKDEEPFT